MKKQDEKKDVFNQLNLLLKNLPDSDSTFLTSDFNVDYWELKTYIETKIRGELSRHLDYIKQLSADLKAMRDEIYAYEYPESTNTDQLIKSFKEQVKWLQELYTEKSTDIDKKHKAKYKIITDEYQSYRNHLKQFEIETVREIDLLKRENKELRTQIKKLQNKDKIEEKTFTKLDTGMNFKIRQNPT